MEEKRLCESNLDSCPCKVVNMEEKVSYCNFINRFAESLIADNEKKTKKTEIFLKKVCSDVRNEILNHDHKAKQLQKQKKEFLKKVKFEDVCFCTAEKENVTFLEHPSNIHGDVKYKTIEGKIHEAPSFCFRIMSKGSKWGEYKSDDKEEIDSYERLARRYGYRVEIRKVEQKYYLKIFGDLQEEVDRFVINLENGFILDEFYDL